MRAKRSCGEAVRVLVRRRADAEAWERRGAEARTVSLEDSTALSRALEGCSGLFVLLPFDLTADNPDAHAEALAGSVAAAVADQRIAHVVMLSSGGADLPEGPGPIAGLYRMEQALRATGATVTALRSGHFQEKVLDVLDTAQREGVYPVFAASADEQRPLVAASDVGKAAAQALPSPPEASETVDVLGPTYSERDVAATLSVALGKDLHVATIPESAWADTLVEAGLRPHWQTRSSSSASASSRDFATSMIRPTSARTGR